MERNRLLIYGNILLSAAALTCMLQQCKQHQSNVAAPTEAEIRQMRIEDSIRFGDIKREADYVIPDDAMLPTAHETIIYHINKQ